MFKKLCLKVDKTLTKLSNRKRAANDESTSSGSGSDTTTQTACSELKSVLSSASEPTTGIQTTLWDPPLKSKSLVSKDDFVVLRPLGKGATAKVFLVRKLDTGKLFAMKVVSKAQMLDKRSVRNLFCERNVLKRTQNHPFITKLHYTFQSEHQLFFVMDYLEGGDFETFLDRIKFKRLPEKMAQFYAAEILLALEYLHSHGVVYRDLKPANILMDDRGHLCLADMGLCKLFDSGSGEPSHNPQQQQRCSTFVGTPLYVAPEILRGGSYDQAVDWWSFGILLFRMLCGDVPFNGEKIPQIFDRILRKPVPFGSFPWLSPVARDLIGKLLEKDEQKRLNETDVKNHPFFTGVVWDQLHRRPPPMRYNVAAATDAASLLSASESLTNEMLSDEDQDDELDLNSPTGSIGADEQKLFADFTFAETTTAPLAFDRTQSFGATGHVVLC